MKEPTTQPQDTGSSPVQALDTQIAVHLFGWRWLDDAQLWRDPDGLVCDPQAFRRQLPAYSRVPAATALVWQWVETRPWIDEICFLYPAASTSTPRPARCDLVYRTGRKGAVYGCATGAGATWPEALCRAALQIAETQEEGEA